MGAHFFCIDHTHGEFSLCQTALLRSAKRSARSTAPDRTPRPFLSRPVFSLASIKTVETRALRSFQQGSLPASESRRDGGHFVPRDARRTSAEARRGRGGLREEMLTTPIINGRAGDRPHCCSRRARSLRERSASHSRRLRVYPKYFLTVLKYRREPP